MKVSLSSPNTAERHHLQVAQERTVAQAKLTNEKLLLRAFEVVSPNARDAVVD